MAQLQLEVVTPERRVLSEEVDMVVVPGLGGELGILPGHTPLISQLQTGVLSYTQGGRTSQLHVSGGFLEVRDDHVSVLAEIAERPSRCFLELSLRQLLMLIAGCKSSKREPRRATTQSCLACRRPII